MALRALVECLGSVWRGRIEIAISYGFVWVPKFSFNCEKKKTKKEPYKMGERPKTNGFCHCLHTLLYIIRLIIIILFIFPFFFFFSFLLCFLSWFLWFQVSIPLFLQTREIDSRPRLRPGQLHIVWGLPAVSLLFFGLCTARAHLGVLSSLVLYQTLVLHANNGRRDTY